MRIWLTAAAVAALAIPFAAADDRASRPLTIAKQGFFYAGGSSPADQMFVEYQIPAKVRSAYPIVMIHGQFQNGSNFLGTPDDREGWAEYFVRRGYAVYVVDQPTIQSVIPITTGGSITFTANATGGLSP